MDTNPYQSPPTSATRSAEHDQHALAFWLAVLGGSTLLIFIAGLVIYWQSTDPPDLVLAIQWPTYLLVYATLSIWIARRVRHGQGIKATRYLLFVMIPFVAGEIAMPFFAIATGIPLSSRVVLVFLILSVAHIYSYVSAWRCVVRLHEVSGGA